MGKQRRKAGDVAPTPQKQKASSGIPNWLQLVPILALERLIEHFFSQLLDFLWSHALLMIQDIIAHAL